MASSVVAACAPSRPARRVCLVTELLSPPLDEGMKIFASQLARGLDARCELLVLTSASPAVAEVPARHVAFGRTLLSPALRAHLRQFRPDTVVYVPQASLTTWSFARALVLRRLAPQAGLVVVGLQPRPLSRLGRRLARMAAPLRLFVQSRETARRLLRAGLEATCVASGVDLRRFRPVSRMARGVLREKYGLSRDAFVLGHVGHLRASRNLGLLARLRDARTQVVVAASTSTPADDAVRRELTARGVFVWDRFLGAIEELHQLCDAYVFPVLDGQGCIEVPLSILEALACGVPVVSTRFADLEWTLPASEAVLYFDGEQEAAACVEAVRRHPDRSAAARRTAEAFGWERALEPLFRSLEVLR